MELQSDVLELISPVEEMPSFVHNRAGKVTLSTISQGKRVVTRNTEKETFCKAMSRERDVMRRGVREWFHDEM